MRWVYYVPLALQSIYGSSDEGVENEDGKEGMRFLEEEREWRLPGLVYANDLVLFDESEHLKAMVGRFSVEKSSESQYT